MKTLELKYVLPYIPFDVLAIDELTNEKRKITLWHSTYNTNTVGINHILYEGLLLKKHKLILRPLRDLVKRINDDENNLTYSAYLKLWAKEDLDFAISNPLGLCYESICQLLEWHFDVFGLIEQELAVDLNKI